MKTNDGDNLTHDYYGFSTSWSTDEVDEQDAIVRPVLAWIDGGCVGRVPSEGGLELAITSRLVKEIHDEPRLALTANGHGALLRAVS